MALNVFKKEQTDWLETASKKPFDTTNVVALAADTPLNPLSERGLSL
jgi:hypothetical protein